MDHQDDLPDPLIVGSLRLEVQSSPVGDTLSGTDPETEPLAFVVNAALGGVLDGLVDALRDGRSMWKDGLFVLRRKDIDGPVPQEAIAAWTDLTGDEPDDDSYLIGAEFLDLSLWVPRAVLLSLIDQLTARRGAR